MASGFLIASVVIFGFFLKALLVNAAVDLGDNSDTQPGILYANTRNFTQGGAYERNLNTVLGFLVNGSTTYQAGSFPDDAYGYRRCFFDTTEAACNSCIRQARNSLLQYRPLTVGARFWLNSSSSSSCYLRFENGQFSLVSPPPAPQPPAPSPGPVSPPNPSDSEGGSSSNKTGVYVGVGVGAGAAALLGLCVCLYCFFVRKPKRLGDYAKSFRRDLEVRSNEAVVFGYEALKAATGNFSTQSELGKGGFGTVYKGILSDGSQVAVKQLSLQSFQGQHEFVNEITIITGIQHRNLVRLKGYCVEFGQRLLVYEFLENGSLDQALFGQTLVLNWQTRRNIVMGVARGLTYLHEDSHTQIIHRDIKASNILLDKKLNSKISDFGISKLFDQEKGFTSTKVAGTLGYLAPEYATHGRLTSKVDVFSFGVLVLEIVSGRRCHIESLPPEQRLLLEWAWSLLQSDKLEQLIDRRLVTASFNADEVYGALHIALLCTHENEEMRPMMSEVVAMLQGFMPLTPLPKEPPRYLFHLHDLKSSSTSNSTTKSSLDSTGSSLSAR